MDGVGYNKRAVQEQFDTSPVENSKNPIESGAVHTALAGKQDTLTFDTAPAQSSTNPVTSDGLYTEFSKRVPSRTLNMQTYTNLPAEDKQADILYHITDDYTPSGVYTTTQVDNLLSTKQDSITATGVLQCDGSGGITAKAVDTDPTTSSTNLVTSGGVKSALDNKQDTLSIDTASLTNNNDHVPSSALVKSALTSLESDLAGIHATGTTNTTGVTITNGTYFYLNGILVQAKTDIANGETFTNGTNYTVVTAGALNELKSAFEKHTLGTAVSILSYTTENNMYTVPHDGYVIMSSGSGQGNYCLLYTDGNVVLGLARTPVALYNTYIPVFVRKGMHLRVDQGSTGGANYYPLN